MNTKYKQTEIGEIPEDWSILSVGEFSEVIGGGTPSTKDELNFNGEIPWITPRDLSNWIYKRISKGERSITEKGLNGSGAKLLPKDTVLLTSRAPVGYVAIASNPVTTNQGFKSLVPNNNADSDFLYYLLKNNTERLKNNASGSTFQELSGGVLKQMIFGLPSVREQREIASILSSLDDRIELNWKMNKTLEDMAKVLFKHWFVDFEFPNEEGKPYKSSGGEIIESELGLIPIGWKVGVIGDISEVMSGKRPQNKLEEKDDYHKIPVFGASKVMGYTNNALFNESIIVIGRVGTHGLVQRVSNESWPSDNTLIIKSAYFEYIYQILKSIDYTNLNVGAVQPLITQTDIKKYKILVPAATLLNHFENIVSLYFSKIKMNDQEVNSLTVIRDSLLPKLMSGKIRIK